MNQLTPHIAGYDLEDAGFLSIVPYVANFFSVMVYGWLFDYLQVTMRMHLRYYHIHATAAMSL